MENPPVERIFDFLIIQGSDISSYNNISSNQSTYPPCSYSR